MTLLDSSAGAALVGYARQVLAHQIAGGEPPQAPEMVYHRAHGGVFVTLTHGSRLRGCMGTFKPLGSFLETLESVARSAAQDPRFSHAPLAPGELAGLHIEISIVMPPQPATAEQIVVGRHGIIVRRGAASGCFLPQVAVRHGWSASEFLSQCCAMKAGLPLDAWTQPDTEILLFEAEVFP